MMRRRVGTNNNETDDNTTVFAGESINIPSKYAMIESDANKCDKSWVPIHTLYQWCDSQIRDRITILVLLPSRIGSKEVLVGITGGGTKMEIVVRWPRMLC